MTDTIEPTAQPALPQRGRLQGTWQIVQFNWPFYLGATLLCLLAAPVLARLPLPGWMKASAALGLGAAVFWIVASLVVSFWVYDCSPLYQWTWIKNWLPAPTEHWANIHSGFDETSIPLRHLFPGGQNLTFDIYDETEMTEPSIRRARALYPAPVPAISVDPTALPLRDEELDTVFLIFAAHELRDATLRLRFFQELQRVLQPGGHVLLVEHGRDLPNFVAFGPGFWHFLPPGEWRRLAREAGLSLLREGHITPFVHVFLLERAP